MKRECVTSRATGNRLVIRKILSASLALLLLEVAAGSAQGQTAVLSQTTWGGFGTDVASGVAVAVDGSSYVVGTTDSFTTDPFGISSPSIFLLKVTATGSLAWQRIWNGPTFTGFAQGPAVALSAGALPGNPSDDSIYVTGLTTSNGNDAVLLKFDASGNLLWQRTWGGSQIEETNSVATAPDGSVYIAGNTQSFGASGSSLFVVKFDSAGTLVWQKIWDGSGGIAAVAVAPDGSVYAASTTPRAGGQIGQFNIIALKITSAGSLTWQRTYAAGDIVDPRGGMTVAPDGSIYIAGAIQIPRMQFVDIAALVVRLGPTGNLLLDGQWAGKSSETAAGVAAAADSSVYIAGTSSSSGAGGEDAFVLHLLPSGKIAAAATWGGTGFDEGSGVAVAGDGTIVLAALAQAPPYSLLGASKKLSMVKGTLAIATGTLGDAAGTVSNPGAAVTIPNGSTTFGGSIDAALVRLVP
jgi:beta-propeller uncharacterized protein DUF5122